MKRGACRVCGNPYPICKDGTIKLHRPCPGSRQEPRAGLWDSLVELSPVSLEDLSKKSGMGPAHVRQQLRRWRNRELAVCVDGLWITT